MDTTVHETYSSAYEDKCVIFDDFGIVIQLTLGLVCFAALVIKRYTDPYRRGWLVWFMVTMLYNHSIGQLETDFWTSLDSRF